MEDKILALENELLDVATALHCMNAQLCILSEAVCENRWRKDVLCDAIWAAGDHARCLAAALDDDIIPRFVALTKQH